jgi:hypothetical protein
MMMRNTQLVDMFGLSADPATDDQLDDFLLRLESEVPDTLYENSAHTHLPSFITIAITNSESGGDVPFNQRTLN